MASRWGSACSDGELDEFPTCGWATDAAFPDGIPCVAERRPRTPAASPRLDIATPPALPGLPPCLASRPLPTASCPPPLLSPASPPLQLLPGILLHLRRPQRLRPDAGRPQVRRPVGHRRRAVGALPAPQRRLVARGGWACGCASMGHASGGPEACSRRGERPALVCTGVRPPQGFLIGEFSLDFAISLNVTVVRQPASGANITTPRSSGNSTSGATTATQVLSITPARPLQLDASRRVSARLLGDMASYQQEAQLDGKWLLVPFQIGARQAGAGQEVLLACTAAARARQEAAPARSPLPLPPSPPLRPQARAGSSTCLRGGTSGWWWTQAWCLPRAQSATRLGRLTSERGAQRRPPACLWACLVCPCPLPRSHPAPSCHTR